MQTKREKVDNLRVEVETKSDWSRKSSTQGRATAVRRRQRCQCSSSSSFNSKTMHTTPCTTSSSLAVVDWTGSGELVVSVLAAITSWPSLWSNRTTATLNRTTTTGEDRVSETAWLSVQGESCYTDSQKCNGLCKLRKSSQNLLKNVCRSDQNCLFATIHVKRNIIKLAQHNVSACHFQFHYILIQI